MGILGQSSQERYFDVQFLVESMNMAKVAEMEYKISPKRSLKFVVWDSRRDLRRVWRAVSGVYIRRGKKHDIGGMCHYLNDGSAEIHLLLECLGAEVFSHEVQHFMYCERGFRLRRDGDRHTLNEDLAKMCGKIHAKFMRWYYTDVRFIIRRMTEGNSWV